MSIYRLSDGTDISRMTVDQITAAQQRADQKFLEEARKRSPKFPTVNEILERRQKAREAFAARTLGILALAGLVVAIWDSFGWVIAGVNFVGFVVTCFVAGNREYKRNGNGGSNGHRPF